MSLLLALTDAGGAPSKTGSASGAIGNSASASGRKQSTGSVISSVGATTSDFARKSSKGSIVASIGIYASDISSKNTQSIVAATVGISAQAVLRKSVISSAVASLGNASYAAGASSVQSPALNGSASAAIGVACSLMAAHGRIGISVTGNLGLYGAASGLAGTEVIPPAIGGYGGAVFSWNHKFPAPVIAGKSIGRIGLAGSAKGIKHLTHRPAIQRRREESLLLAA